MKFISAIILLMSLARPIAAGTDPAWLAAIAPNQLGGYIGLGAVQNPPCTGEWYNAVSIDAKANRLHGCWKFEGVGVTIAWADKTSTHYDLMDFRWSDWVTEGEKKPTPPADDAKPKIEHKDSDIIS